MISTHSTFQPTNSISSPARVVSEETVPELGLVLAQFGPETAPG